MIALISTTSVPIYYLCNIRDGYINMITYHNKCTVYSKQLTGRHSSLPHATRITMKGKEYKASNQASQISRPSPGLVHGVGSCQHISCCSALNLFNCCSITSFSEGVNVCDVHVVCLVRRCRRCWCIVESRRQFQIVAVSQSCNSHASDACDSCSSCVDSDISNQSSQHRMSPDT